MRYGWLGADLVALPHRIGQNDRRARWGASCPRQGNFPTQTGSSQVAEPSSMPVLSGLRAISEEGMNDEHPRRRSLERLRKEAKRWLAALRNADADARARLERASPNAPAAPTLRDVQHALAAEQGYPGWAALKRQVAGDAEASSATLA